MTSAQVEYLKHLETQRHNRAVEGEEQRHNQTTETETGRHNVREESVQSSQAGSSWARALGAGGAIALGGNVAKKLISKLAGSKTASGQSNDWFAGYSASKAAQQGSRSLAPKVASGGAKAASAAASGGSNAGVSASSVAAGTVAVTAAILATALAIGIEDARQQKALERMAEILNKYQVTPEQYKASTSDRYETLRDINAMKKGQSSAFDAKIRKMKEAGYFDEGGKYYVKPST